MGGCHERNTRKVRVKKMQVYEESSCKKVYAYDESSCKKVL